MVKQLGLKSQPRIQEVALFSIFFLSLFLLHYHSSIYYFCFLFSSAVDTHWDVHGTFFILTLMDELDTLQLSNTTVNTCIFNIYLYNCRKLMSYWRLRPSEIWFLKNPSNRHIGGHPHFSFLKPTPSTLCPSISPAGRTSSLHFCFTSWIIGIYVLYYSYFFIDWYVFSV